MNAIEEDARFNRNNYHTIPVRLLEDITTAHCVFKAGDTVVRRYPLTADRSRHPDLYHGIPELGNKMGIRFFNILGEGGNVALLVPENKMRLLEVG